MEVQGFKYTFKNKDNKNKHKLTNIFRPNSKFSIIKI